MFPLPLPLPMDCEDLGLAPPPCGTPFEATSMSPLGCSCPQQEVAIFQATTFLKNDFEHINLR